MEPLTTLIGRSPSCSTTGGLLFMRTSYSRSPIFAVPDGQGEVLRRQGDVHVVRRQALRLERLQVEIDHDLAHLAAHGQRDRGALDDGQLHPQEVEPEVEEPLLGERLAAQAELEDGHVRGVEADDQRGGAARAAGCWMTVWLIAVTCATAASMLVPGWK